MFCEAQSVDSVYLLSHNHRLWGLDYEVSVRSVLGRVRGICHSLKVSLRLRLSS